jgi:hypothetical protein
MVKYQKTSFDINHSYISDNSYVLGYIDFYCFNYVDIEKNGSETYHVGLNSTGINYLNSDSDKDRVEV